MKKTASLTMEADYNKLWRLTKQLNNEESRHAKITLLQTGGWSTMTGFRERHYTEDQTTYQAQEI